jgi:S-adenosylmethionine:tRNA ribosyltransferase-isomerase
MSAVAVQAPERVDEFDYELPRDLIADRPIVPRDAARLLEVGDELRDLAIRDLPGLLNAGDVLVTNDTRVIPARLFGRRAADPAGARGETGIEVTLLREEAADTWQALARPARRLKPADWIAFAPGFSAHVADTGAEGEVRLAFNLRGPALRAALERFGAMPLPPYIARPHGPDARDRFDYQTIFAEKEGAVAAPTAGLHFTPELLSRIDERGVRRLAVTLHVGAGTFLPVRVERVKDHRMHAEAGVIEAGVAAAVNDARARGGRVVAVGSTVLRLLETAAESDGRVRPFDGETDIFITPGYRFKAVDLLLTNFHLPRSTLFMLVCAFAGVPRMRAAYAHAVKERYRFYSYGDCCLLHLAGYR